jgi:hypothetical protein
MLERLVILRSFCWNLKLTRWTATAGASLALDGLVLSDSALTSALTSRARAYREY